MIVIVIIEEEPLSDTHQHLFFQGESGCDTFEREIEQGRQTTATEGKIFSGTNLQQSTH